MQIIKHFSSLQSGCAKKPAVLKTFDGSINNTHLPAWHGRVIRFDGCFLKERLSASSFLLIKSWQDRHIHDVLNARRFD